MIIVNLISGLGNQLFQYAIARNISLKKKIELKLDISFFSTQTLRNYQLDKFNIAENLASIQDLKRFTNLRSKHSVRYKIQRNIDNLLPKHKRKIFSESDLWIYEESLEKISNHTYIDGYWQNKKYLKDLHPIVLEELTLKNVDNNDYSHYLFLISKSNSVSIHIRRGDYLGDKNANEIFGVLSIDYYNRAIDHIKTQVENPLFFIFSDDLNWAEEQFKIQATFVKIENGQKPYLELDLMSKCKHNIIANSSFSWWGAFLNRNSSKIVIMPKRWVLDENINAKINLKLSNWIQL